MPNLSQEDVNAICDELERRQSGRAKMSDMSLPTPPPEAPPAADRPSFLIKNADGLQQNSRHFYDGACPECQSGYPRRLNDPELVVTGLKPAPEKPDDWPAGKHWEAPAPEPIMEPDPNWQPDEHSLRCDGQVHAVLFKDSLTEHSLKLVCGKRGCDWSAIRVYPHALT